MIFHTLNFLRSKKIMANKIRTHRGRVIDLDDIKMKNQTATTVGNMNVNARGDELDEWGNIIKPRDQVAREKNSSMSRKSTNASVISSFEDDDVYELKDDPNVLNKNRTKTNPTPQRNTQAKVDDKKTDDKKSESKPSTDTKADETDLD